jgi:hypothetical protein
MKLWATDIPDPSAADGAGNPMVKAVRAIREAARKLDSPGSERITTFAGATSAYRSVKSGPVLIGVTDDREAMRAAGIMLQDAGVEVEVTADTDHPGQPEADEADPTGSIMDFMDHELDLDDEDDDDLPPYEASQVAMLLMVMTEGEPLKALMFSRNLGRITRDDLYRHVDNFILDCFPPPSPAALAEALASVREG